MTIKLDTTKYRMPSQDEIDEAKRYIVRREQFGAALQERIDEILSEAAEDVVHICYAYNIDPKRLYFGEGFNKEMMDEIASVMDDVEDEILSLIINYSTRATDDQRRISILAAWIALLGKGNRNLRDTLHGYLNKALKDWEAAIAAMSNAGLNVAKASTRIRTYLHQIYNMPEVRSAFKRWQEFAATYIRSRGVQYGAVGISNNGSTNVTNMAKITLQMAWMKAQMLEFEDMGAIGYIQLRGSSYLCSVCDDETGFHYGLPENLNWPHPNCQCYRIPVYKIGDEITLL